MGTSGSRGQTVVVNVTRIGVCVGEGGVGVRAEITVDLGKWEMAIARVFLVVVTVDVASDACLALHAWVANAIIINVAEKLLYRESLFL